MKRVCVITGSRAEYGLLKWLMHGLDKSRKFDLQVIVTGQHLSTEFGETWHEIERDGFLISRKVETLVSSDTGIGTAKSIALGVAGIADVLADLEPHAVVVLGDRFEILAAALASMSLRIPIVHIHGGELTAGAIDDAIRHAITKLSHLHFVATSAARRRIIQMGESPETVHVVGALGLDGVANADLLSRPDLESALNIDLSQDFLVVTFHPETLAGNPMRGLPELLSALDQLREMTLIFTIANSDPSARYANTLVRDFANTHPQAHTVDSLGQRLYLSALRHSRGVVGNSSSGIIEAPALSLGTVNIGGRQAGRERGPTVIDCEPTVASIGAALAKLLSASFQSGLRHVNSPYGRPGASQRILQILEGIDSFSVTKSFFDVRDQETVWA